MLIFNFPNTHYALCSPILPCLFACFCFCIFSILIFFSLLYCVLFFPPPLLSIPFPPQKMVLLTLSIITCQLSQGCEEWLSHKPEVSFGKSPLALSNSWVDHHCRVDSVAEMETLGFFNPGSWTLQKKKRRQRKKGIKESDKMKLPENFMHFPLLSQLDDLPELARAQAVNEKLKFHFPI